MTGKELFDISLDLCGLRKTNGEHPEDISDLSQRGLSLINIVLAENAEIDSKIRRIEHEVPSISSLDDEINCSDIILSSVIPFGLARLLVLGEDDKLASDFHRLYMNGRENAIRFGKARVAPIAEVYK